VAKVYITTPFPTTEEVAAHYGISPARVAELERMLEEIRAERAERAARTAKRTRVASRAKKK